MGINFNDFHVCWRTREIQQVRWSHSRARSAFCIGQESGGTSSSGVQPDAVPVLGVLEEGVDLDKRKTTRTAQVEFTVISWVSLF